MKRFLYAMLMVGALLCCCACNSTNTPKTVVAKGQPYTWSEGNVITVTQVEVNNGEVIVEVEVDFSTANPEELKQITMRKTNGEEQQIPCRQVLIQQNHVYLVFESPVIKGKTDLEQYVLTVPVGKDNHGKMVTKDAMSLS